MTCQDLREQILDHDWNEARIQDACRISEHLRACESCRRCIREYDQLRAALRSPLDDDALSAQAPHPIPARPDSAQSRRLAPRPLIAQAALLLLAVSGWAMSWRLSNTGDPPPRASAPSTPVTRMSQAEVDQRVQLFRAVSDSFDGRASWVSESSGSNSDVGIDSGESTHAPRVLLLRLGLARGRVVIHHADLVIIPGRSAELTAPFGADKKLRYRIGTTGEQPTQLSIWAELIGPGSVGEPLAALATNLRPTPGQVLGAGRLITSAGEYDLEVAYSEAPLHVSKP